MVNNQLEGANSPHFYPEDEPYLYEYSSALQDLVKSIWFDLLAIEKGWNFRANSPWFLESVQDYIEFIPDLLETLKARAIGPFLSAFGKVGTYEGFAQACIGLFGPDVAIIYEDNIPRITITNITSPISYYFVSEGRDDFYFITEDGINRFVSSPIFVPPTGLGTIRNVLRAFLPAGQYEITEIVFAS